MAGIAGGAGEAILICVADFITGTVILDQLVYPDEMITQMRHEIHGISKRELEGDFAQGKTLSGWNGARAELWKYIDHNTIIVGHSLEHDLAALRIIHPRIVDAGILSRNGGVMRTCGLQQLCEELLFLEIRTNAKGIHDCMEDVMASREVVLFCLQNKTAFEAWAERRREKEALRLEEVERAKEKKKAEKEKELGRLKELEKTELEKNPDKVNKEKGKGRQTELVTNDEIMRWPIVLENTRYRRPAIPVPKFDHWWS
jgi:hypothetical protein